MVEGVLHVTHLGGCHSDPDAKRVIGLALEMAREALGLADNFANGIIAKQIIELRAASVTPIFCVKAH